jgi:hypothetical protein
MNVVRRSALLRRCWFKDECAMKRHVYAWTERGVKHSRTSMVHDMFDFIHRSGQERGTTAQQRQYDVFLSLPERTWH